MVAAPPRPRYLLDTNIVVHYTRKNDLARYIEATYGLLTVATAPLISVVTEGELESLVLQLAWGLSKQRQLQMLIQRFVSVPLDYPGIIRAYGQIDHFSRQAGRKMSKNDLWIAATAHATGARLLTTDRDFDHLTSSHIQLDWIDPASILPGTP